MFLHVSDSHSVPVHAGIQQPRADTSPPPWADTPLLPHPPQQTATAADGMHPTGMHSCFGQNVTSSED